MQLAVEEKCEFLPFLSPKKVIINSHFLKISLVLIPVLSYNSITVLSICIFGGQECCCDWLRLAVRFLMQWSSITEMLAFYLRLVCGYCFN